jgi:hypothetical protein
MTNRATEGNLHQRSNKRHPDEVAEDDGLVGQGSGKITNIASFASKSPQASMGIFS